MRKQHLTFDLIDAYNSGIKGHPQDVMIELGIKYQHATPQSMGDCWWFWNCESEIEEIPSYLKHLDLDPLKCIGWGLNQELAEKIKAKEDK